MKRARSTAGWLKQKSKLLVLLTITLCATFGSALMPLTAHAATPDAVWKDNYKTLVYNGQDYSGPWDGPTSGKQVMFGQGNPVLDSGFCTSVIIFDNANTTTYKTMTTAHVNTGIKTGSTCTNFGTGTPITVDSTANNPTATGGSSGGTNNSSGGQVATEDPCNATGDPLSWIICPVINMINGAIIKMQAIIDNLLEFDVATVFDRNKDSGKAYYAAWNSFRLVGIAVVVIAGLVMVITQALGLEVFDAYTVKKVVPRLFIAAIGISLSWYLLQFLANVTNDVGLAVRNMIYWPFRNIGDGNTGLTSASGFLAGDLLVGGVLFALGIAGTLSLVVTAGLAALVAFLVLILRQIVLILLILLAPLAIALYVLPNTQKAYQLWWDAISKGFMMFPIITAFIATGRVFSVVAANATGGGSSIHHTVNEVISLIAFFLPYFALPFTFRLAGGAIGTLAGLTNDRSRGAFDRLKKYRANQAAIGWERKKNNNLFRGGNDTNFRGKLNRGVASTINAPGAITESGSLLKPGDWRTAVRSDRQNRAFAEIERNMKENHAYMPWMNNDGLNRAASETRNAAELENYLVKSGDYVEGSRDLKDTVDKIETVRRSMSPEAFKAMTTRQAIAGGTAYKSSSAPGAPKTAAGDVMAAIARASVDDEGLAGSLVANARSDGMRAGRIDYAGAGFGTTITEVNRMRQELKDTGTISDATIQDVTRKIHKDVYESQGGASLVHSSMKPDAVKEMVPDMIQDVEMARATGDDREFVQSLASLNAIYDGMRGSNPTKAKIMADDVFSRPIDVASLRPEMRARLAPALRQVDADGNASTRLDGTITYQQAMSALSGDSEWREMVREYGNEVDRVRGQQPPDPNAGPGAPPPGAPGAP